MKTVFLNGWGISLDEASAALERRGLRAFLPLGLGPNCLERCLESDAEQLIAYSTGAFLVLRHPAVMERFDKVVLLAPFFDLKAESRRGGKVRTAQLKYLLRWLAKDPLAAVNDFRKRAGLSAEPLVELPADSESLVWGIEALRDEAVEPSVAFAGVGYVGDQDDLLDAAMLADMAEWIRLVPEAGHDLGGLLRAADLTL